MENHHSKQHGKIDPSLMEDRTAELFSKCQVSASKFRNCHVAFPFSTLIEFFSFTLIFVFLGVIHATTGYYR